MFTPNLDNTGRIARLVMAILFLVFGIIYGSWIALLISAFIFFEALRGWCFVYQILGINRCPIDKK